MAATPANLTFKSLNDQWAMNWGLCDPNEPMLKLQGIPWLMRRIINLVSVSVAIKTWQDSQTGLTNVLMEYKPPLGLPSSSEQRTLNFEGDELTVPFYGRLRVSMRWASTKELDEIDEYLEKGFEEGPNTVVHMMSEHLDIDAVTHQAFGFEEIDGIRFHTRHIVVKRGNDVARLRLVYDYIGPRPADT